MVTREEWAKSFLTWIAAPVTTRNLVALVAWQAAEGGPPYPQALWNPLNTTLKWGGSWSFNWVGVQNYPTESTGLEATGRTLLLTKDANGPLYDEIYKRLRRSAKPRSTLDAVEASNWGTGGLAKSIVDDVKRHYDAYSQVPIGQ